MNPFRKLAGQTAIYGLSSIIGRFLNYLLVPLHTSVYATDQYGVITEMYSYVAFLVVMLTYGMETAFFRYYNKVEDDKKKLVFSTAVVSLLTSSTVFITMSMLFSHEIADWLLYPDHREYVMYFALIVGVDAISAIGLAKLRATDRPVEFAKINVISIAVNILMNCYLFIDPSLGVGWVFISNLAATGIKFILLTPQLFGIQLRFDAALWRRMLIYAAPLLVAGLAGIVNETLDRILLKRMLYSELGQEETLSQLGIYGAVYKISIIITLFIQAFRYAAEPFFFSEEKNKNSKKVFSRVMTYFVITVSTIFLGVTLFLDVFKYFIPNEEYWVGLKVVPILMLANICLGIYFNQSIWYKLSDKTIYGAYLAIIGAVITIVLNVILIPKFSYVGSAWATLICYATMVVISWYWGHKHYPIKYNMRKIFLYLGLALVLYFLSTTIDVPSPFIEYVIRAMILCFYLFVIYLFEKPQKPKELSHES